MAKRKAAAPKDNAAPSTGPSKNEAFQAISEGLVNIGKSADLKEVEAILLRLANRHGLVTGATGTGKTVTLQGLAEGFSDQGVPVFCADVKGDLSGLAEKGEMKSWIEARDQAINFTQSFSAYPVIFWDLFGEQGLPIRTTVSEMGPLLLSRLMDLSDAQEGVLNIAFKIADDEKLPLTTLSNLQTLLEGLAARADTLTTKYGNVTKASIGSIQRSLLVLDRQGGSHFFGTPMLAIKDLMLKDGKQGCISVLAAEKLMEAPRLYSTFLLVLLSELFEEMPEVGDPEKPALVFFFDEAHLLFKDAPKALLEKVEQVVRLIRSKGVGVYFVTQNPLDIPDTVSRQLGNRVQHALRAFSPMEQKAVKAAATTFRANPAFDTEKAIMELGIGEALVSTLDEKGQPSIVQRTLVRPPNSRVGPITDRERSAAIAESRSRVGNKYPDKAEVDDGAEKRLRDWADQRATAKDQDNGSGATRTTKTSSSGASPRSDGFWTTLGKQIVKSGVPMATRVIEGMIKGRGRGGGFTGFGAVDTGQGSRSPAQAAGKKEDYVPFKSIPDSFDDGTGRGILGGRKR
jgi:DNA helicase HerA-like ATPase